MKDGIGTRSRRIGLVINTALKPSRDFLLGAVNGIHSGGLGKPLLFLAGSATSPVNIRSFAENGLDGMIFCGLRRDIAVEFGRLMPNHPSVVLCTYAPLSAEDWDLLGYGGEVVLDNVAIGVQAADFFVSHGLKHFAFLAANAYRERIAGKIRSEAFMRRVKERLGANGTFAKCMVGVVSENEDFWEVGSGDTEKWIKALPRPCGLLVNGDREAANVIFICRCLGIRVPDDIEVLGVNNSQGLCEQAHPSISSLCPDYASCASVAVDMLMSLLSDPVLPFDRRSVKVAACRLVERGSTSSGEYGHVVARAREFIIKNACRGIDVSDVVGQVGISRRLLEKRVRAATGQTILDMIQKVRLENVCNLLVTTTLPVSEVTSRSGYELTSNLSRLFRKTFGMSMSEYRRSYGKVNCKRNETPRRKFF